MNKKVSKTNSFGGPSTPTWVWVIIFIIFFQIAKLAYRNNWFIEKKNIPNKYEKPEWFDELVNKKLTAVSFLLTNSSNHSGFSYLLGIFFFSINQLLRYANLAIWKNMMNIITHTQVGVLGPPNELVFETFLFIVYLTYIVLPLM